MANNPRPFDVPLDLVLAALPKEANAHQEGDAILVRHPNFTTRLDVVSPPAGYKPRTGAIQAVIQIRSALPVDVISTAFKEPAMISAGNASATLGALTLDGGETFVGSRVTFYGDDKQAWKIYFPMILETLRSGTTSLMGAFGRAFTKKSNKRGKSSWTQSDLEMTGTQLLRLCVCTVGPRGLTAEFGLGEGDVTAGKGDSTALLQLATDAPHPEMGGGLFCLLQMPHQLEDEKSLDELLLQLNRMEMEPYELAPHFGAWCRGRAGLNPAYVCFLPNALHTSAIALNVSICAKARANWANSALSSLGIPSPAADA